MPRRRIDLLSSLLNCMRHVTLSRASFRLRAFRFQPPLFLCSPTPSIKRKPRRIVLCTALSPRPSLCCPHAVAQELIQATGYGGLSERTDLQLDGRILARSTHKLRRVTHRTPRSCLSLTKQDPP